MKYARILKENGSSQSNNYMLDDVMDTLNHFGISNEDPNNDELIKRLTIEKIEFARRCMAQLVSQSGNIKELFQHYDKLNNALQERIIFDLDGEPYARTLA